ncbi:MAG: hypothetical protein HC896_13025 [Bacteroidales bacterium]|nr:hypothetical protein [Bacteroidales bacterium]
MQHFSLPYEPESRLDNLFMPTGSQFGGLSADYYWQQNKWHMFGEQAVAANRQTAFVNGANWYMHSSFSLSVINRRYSRGFHSFYSNAFAESSTINNEQGTYIGCQFLAIKNLLISAYADLFSFPWHRYGDHVKSHGNEQLVMARYSLGSLQSIRLYYKHESKLKDETNEWAYRAYFQNKDNLKLEYQIDISDHASGQVFWQQVWAKTGSATNHGTASGFRTRYSLPNGRWQLNYAAILFSTPDFETRIYAYQPNVLYAFSVPAYYGQGTENIVMVRYAPVQHIGIWLRYTNLHKSGNSIGTGDEEITGNKKKR